MQLKRSAYLVGAVASFRRPSMAASRRPKDELNFFDARKNSTHLLADGTLPLTVSQTMRRPQPSTQTASTTFQLSPSGLVSFKSTKKSLGTTIQKIQPISRDRLDFNGTDQFQTGSYKKNLFSPQNRPPQKSICGFLSVLEKKSTKKSTKYTKANLAHIFMK